MLKIDRQTLEEILLGMFYIFEDVVSLKLLIIQDIQQYISKTMKKHK